MSTCNRLDLETIGCRLLMLKISPDIGYINKVEGQQKLSKRRPRLNHICVQLGPAPAKPPSLFGSPPALVGLNPQI